jgi:hypothetical protein
VYFRGIDIDAPAAVVFRWICQLRVAPYSYDWLDNFGRRSPRQLTTGIEHLKLGDRFMMIFDLVDFEPDRQITLVVRRIQRIFGPAAVTYLIVPGNQDDTSRLLVKLLLGGPTSVSPVTKAKRKAMPWLELIMMRKQLMTLRDLAQASVSGRIAS